MNALKENGKATGTFYFKQFKVEDSRSTMKVGTDAVLLGASTVVSNVSEILEIGTGSGVITLMLAQRSTASIAAVEIDEDSARQAIENVHHSPWKERIQVHPTSLQEYIRMTVRKYDLVVSNPPYFTRSLKPFKKNRNLSRHDETLTHEELARYSYDLLKPEGSLWVILPAAEGEQFNKTAEDCGLHLHLITKIFPKTGKCHFRSILEFKKVKPELITEKTLIIRDTEHNYTKEYMELTGEFYLDF